MKRLLILALFLVSCGAITPEIVPPSVAVPSTTPTQISMAEIATPTPTPILAMPTVTPTLQPQAESDQQLALKANYPLQPDLVNLPYYTMRIEVDADAESFRGSQIISYTNTTTATLNDLVLRSYPNFPPDVMGDGGDTRTEVMSVASDGQPLDLRVEKQDTVYRVMLKQPLAPNKVLTLETTFKGTLKAWDDGSYPFLSAYPMLALWDSATQTWRTDVTRFPDRVFAQAAWYDVSVTLPKDLQVFATGSAVTSSNDGKQTTTRFVSSPVREWAASFGRFESLKTITNGITVTVYQTVKSQHDLERVRDMAAGSLQSYEQRFGAYPYRELDLHVMEWDGSGGIEYPAFTIILVPTTVNDRTDFVVAHEVAHQWWYALAGNDMYREPWLDESLANYSAFVGANDVLGAEQAQAYWQNEIERLYQQGEANGGAPAGLAITEYASFNAYYRAVYGKGAVFLAVLREQIGDEAFFAGLRDYYANNQFGIGTRQRFQYAMESASNSELTDVFNQWLGAK